MYEDKVNEKILNRIVAVMKREKRLGYKSLSGLSHVPYDAIRTYVLYLEEQGILRSTRQDPSRPSSNRNKKVILYAGERDEKKKARINGQE